MALDREIERIRKDPDQWRPLLHQLLRHDDLAPRHLGLLDSLAERQRWLEELSYLQAEWLLDIRDEAQTVIEYRGHGVRYLLRCCYENRLDLDEDGEAWVIELHKSGRMPVRKYEARRLYDLAHELGYVDD